MVRRLSSRLFKSPLIRRVRFYAGRASGQLDRRFFVTLVEGILVIVAITAVLITLLEKPWTLAALGQSFYWGLTTVLGQGQASYVTSPAGWFISWLLILFGVALFGTITGALIAIVIDFLLKEGQGMGASGYEGHVVVCGWNTTARDLIAELRSDVYQRKIVLIAQADKNPGGDGVYYVKGDSTEVADLERAGIAEAASAVVFSEDESNEGDMHSILTVMAIKSVAPQVRTVVEVNNPRHVEHLRRAHADEILVSSQLASRLLARSALYPGLTELVTDIVSGGEGSELYRIAIPDGYLGLTLDEVSARLRSEHRATILSISRGGKAFVNPPTDFRIAPGDDAVVVAESLGTLAPLVLRHDESPAPAAAATTTGATHGNGHGPVAHDAPSVAPVAPIAEPAAGQPAPPTVAPTNPSADAPTARSEPVAPAAFADPVGSPVAGTAVADPAPVATQTAVADPTIVVSRPTGPGGPTIVTISPLPRTEGPPVVAIQPVVAQPPVVVHQPPAVPGPLDAPPPTTPDARSPKRKKKHAKK
jgi:voltage-gated potassium channel